jgi:hypothetical protein
MGGCCVGAAWLLHACNVMGGDHIFAKTHRSKLNLPTVVPQVDKINMIVNWYLAQSITKLSPHAQTSPASWLLYPLLDARLHVFRPLLFATVTFTLRVPAFFVLIFCFFFFCASSRFFFCLLLSAPEAPDHTFSPWDLPALPICHFSTAGGIFSEDNSVFGIFFASISKGAHI